MEKEKKTAGLFQYTGTVPALKLYHTFYFHSFILSWAHSTSPCHLFLCWGLFTDVSKIMVSSKWYYYVAVQDSASYQGHHGTIISE